MPRFVRPSWANINIDGRQRFAGGPRSKSGTMAVNFFVRAHGAAVNSVRVETQILGNKHILTVFDEIGRAIHNHVTELD